MKNWTTKEAKLAVEWARTPAEERQPVGELANRLGRTSAAVQEFLRRILPPGQRPWVKNDVGPRRRLMKLGNVTEPLPALSCGD